MTQSQAAYLYRKAQDTSPLAVFVVRGKLKVARPGSELFRDAIDFHGECLMGVYDRRVQREWLEDDLKFMRLTAPSLVIAP